MAKETTVCPRKAHSLPNCMIPLIESLENLEGVVRVGVGHFHGGMPDARTFRWVPKFMCQETNTIKIGVYYSGFSQEIYVTVRPNHVCTLAEFLNNYKP